MNENKDDAIDKVQQAVEESGGKICKPEDMPPKMAFIAGMDLLKLAAHDNELFATVYNAAAAIIRTSMEFQSNPLTEPSEN